MIGPSAARVDAILVPRLVSLQQRLQSYVESWRALPVELPDLTGGIGQSADLLSHVMGSEPPTKGEAATRASR